jgi:hypothetical protein
MTFQKATKRQAKLRLALIGPSGAGKTYTALTLATHLVPGGRIALIDTKRGSASKYGDLFAFDVAELEPFLPRRYIDAIAEAQAAGYDVLIIDSLSHAWMGKDGASPAARTVQLCSPGRSISTSIGHSSSSKRRWRGRLHSFTNWSWICR